MREFRFITFRTLFFLTFFLSQIGWSYPDFIGYGYKTCIMCHYNSQGNGPLTDYGRALFSQEIAARNFWTPKKISDEEIAEKYSGFIPGVQLPYWIRPSVKYRGLMVTTDPKGPNDDSRWIYMQRDFNLVLSLDEASRTIMVLNYGLLAYPQTDFYRDGELKDGVSREHYIRFYAAEKLLVAAGLMDKVYGLRTADHTSYGRGAIGLGQNDQVHGTLIQWIEDDWDASLHLFAGNILQLKENRKAGASLSMEYSLGEKTRIGTSLLTESNDFVQSSRFAIHNRWGFPETQGSSILVEVGIKQDQTTGQKETLGSYGVLQSIINLARGYNFVSTVERAQSEINFSSPELQKWTFGFLLFPFQRTEIRLTAVQNKNFSPSNVTKDQWQAQGQIHVSW
jgi:hypothetical protein